MASPSRSIDLIMVALFAFPLARHASQAFATSRAAPADAVAFPELAKFVRKNAPANAVFLVEDQQRGEHIVAMWWLDRECYPLHEETLANDVASIISAGGEPFILSRRDRAERSLPGVTGEARIYLPMTTAAR